MDMNQLLLRAGHLEQRVAGGRVLGQARADRDDEIRFAEERAELWIRSRAEVTRIAWMEIVDSVLAAERHGSREPVRLRECRDVAHRLRVPRATTEEHDRLLRTGEHLAQTLHVGGV